jgi:hypothetical protein
MNLYECPEHVDLSTPCSIILVTINAMDIAEGSLEVKLPTIWTVEKQR